MASSSPCSSHTGLRLRVLRALSCKSSAKIPSLLELTALQSNRRYSAGLYALLNSNVHLRQASAHVDGQEELDGEVLNPDLTMFGDNTDRPMCSSDTTLQLWLGITHGVLLGAHTALKWIVSPDYSPDSPRSSHSIFDASPGILHANIWQFCGVDRVSRSLVQEIDFYAVTTILVTRLENPVGSCFASQKHLAELASHSASQVLLICRTILRKQQSRLNTRGRRLNS